MSGLRSALLAPCLTFALCTLASLSFATSVAQRPIAVIVEQSPLVFEGRVSSINVEASGKNIFTWVTFEVLDVIKGEYAEPQINLRYLGGSSGDVILRVSDQTIPAYGEHGIYFVESLDSLTTHPLRGWGQGHFILQRDSASGDYVVHNSERKVVKGLSGSKQSAFRANAKTAAGVELMLEAKEPDGERPLSREEFKQFIQGLGQ